jgi:hypothetical protein
MTEEQRQEFRQWMKDGMPARAPFVPMEDEE